MNARSPTPMKNEGVACCIETNLILDEVGPRYMFSSRIAIQVLIGRIMGSHSFYAGSFKFSLPLEHMILKLDEENGSIGPHVSGVIM